jgi:hypothetical protein
VVSAEWSKGHRSTHAAADANKPVIAANCTSSWRGQATSDAAKVHHSYFHQTDKTIPTLAELASSAPVAFGADNNTKFESSECSEKKSRKKEKGHKKSKNNAPSGEPETLAEILGNRDGPSVRMALVKVVEEKLVVRDEPTLKLLLTSLENFEVGPWIVPLALQLLENTLTAPSGMVHCESFHHERSTLTIMNTHVGQNEIRQILFTNGVGKAVLATLKGTIWGLLSEDVFALQMSCVRLLLECPRFASQMEDSEGWLHLMYISMPKIFAGNHFVTKQMSESVTELLYPKIKADYEDREFKARLVKRATHTHHKYTHSHHVHGVACTGKGEES